MWRFVVGSRGGLYLVVTHVVEIVPFVLRLLVLRVSLYSDIVDGRGTA